MWQVPAYQSKEEKWKRSQEKNHTQVLPVTAVVYANKNSEAERVVEVRPTGESFELQGWIYCEACRSQMGLLHKKTIDFESLVSAVNLESDLAFLQLE